MNRISRPACPDVGLSQWQSYGVRSRNGNLCTLSRKYSCGQHDLPRYPTGSKTTI
jgi:hypothetical protein